MSSGKLICKSCRARTFGTRRHYIHSFVSLRSYSVSRPCFPRSASGPIHFTSTRIQPHRNFTPSSVRHQSTTSSGSSHASSGTLNLQDSEINSSQTVAHLVSEPASEPLRATGFLKDTYGLDFGYGPTSLAQAVFEHVHVYSGTDMWLSILGTAIVFRLAMAPIIVRSIENSAKLSYLRPIVNDLTGKMRAAQASGDTGKMQAYNNQRRVILKEHGISSLAPLWNLVQLPLGFGYFRLFRNMSAIPVAGMATGGALWFPNLVIPDPYFMLPMLTGLCQFVQMRHSLKKQANTMPGIATFQNALSYVMPVFGACILSFQPSVLTLYFFCSTSFGLVQHFILYNNRLRTVLGQTPFVDGNEQVVASSSPYKGTITTTARPSRPVDQPKRAERPQPGASEVQERPSGVFSSVKKSLSKGLDRMSNSLPGRGRNWKAEQKEKVRRSRVDQYEKKRATEFEKDKAEYERWVTSKHRGGS